MRSLKAFEVEYQSDGSSDAGEELDEAKALELEQRVSFDEGLDRKTTASLLFFGSVMGLLGFLFAGLIGLLKFFRPSLGEHHRVFASHWGYFPATVSEMVHDPERPAGKCFCAFASIGATFIFLSWYPWRLRNVYIGDSATVWGTGGTLSWMMFRQFVPTSGMMLLASVTTTPFAQANALDDICLGIHLTGALMLFAGYCVVEAISLGWGPFPMPAVTQRTVGKLELRLRSRILTGIVLSYLSFCALQGVLLLPMNNAFGHTDIWEPRVSYNEFGYSHLQRSLVDTATGFVLLLKILSYVSEVTGGLLLICSHLVIWSFCDERNVDLKDELWKVV